MFLLNVACEWRGGVKITYGVVVSVECSTDGKAKAIELSLP